MAETYPYVPKPSFIYVEAVQFNTIISQSESGAERRRRKWAEGTYRNIFTFVYNNLVLAEKNIIKNHHIDRDGSYKTFTFNPYNLDSSLTNNNYTCRFEDDILVTECFTRGNVLRYNIPTFRIIEAW